MNVSRPAKGLPEIRDVQSAALSSSAVVTAPGSPGLWLWPCVLCAATLSRANSLQLAGCLRDYSLNILCARLFRCCGLFLKFILAFTRFIKMKICRPCISSPLVLGYASATAEGPRPLTMSLLGWLKQEQTRFRIHHWGLTPKNAAKCVMRKA